MNPLSLCGGRPFGRGALPLEWRLLAGAPDAARSRVRRAVRRSWLLGLLILAVAFAALFLICTPASDGVLSSGDKTGDEAVTMTIRFREGVGPDVMQAFFDGFNAGSSRSSPSSFGLSIPDRRITATYSDAQKAEPVAFWAERSPSVEEVTVEDAG